MARRAYSYIRFSSSPQERGDSLRRQIDLSQAYAAEHGLELDTDLRLHDLGLSAFDGSNVQRGALGAFLAAIERGKVKKGEFLLVESLDRISRAQVMEALAVFTQIINSGVSIVTLVDRVVYSKEKLASDPMPLIMSILVMIRAHEESATKSRRMREAWANKRRNAATLKLTRTCPSWLELSSDRRQYKIVSQRARVVRRILKMHTGGIGQARIAKTLNEEGVPPIQSRVRTESWHSSTVQKIVTSTALYGAYQPTTGGDNRKRKPHGELIENYYPALITKDEFLSLQRVRTERALKGRGARGREFSNLFSGILSCAYCGGGMNIAAHSSKRKGDSRYIVCSRAKRGLPCYFVSWPYPDFEKLILAFCKGIDFARLLEDDDSAKTLRESKADRLAALQAERGASEQRIKRLLDAVELGEAPSAAFSRIRELEAELEKIDGEIQTTEREVAALASSLEDAGDIQRGVLSLMRKIGQLSEAERYARRARLAVEIRRVVTHIQVWPGGYLMGDEEWKEFTKGVTKAQIKREGLEVLRTPVKADRYAIVRGANGRHYATYNLREARNRRLPEATTLEILGVEY